MLFRYWRVLIAYHKDEHSSQGSKLPVKRSLMNPGNLLLRLHSLIEPKVECFNDAFDSMLNIIQGFHTVLV